MIKNISRIVFLANLSVSLISVSSCQKDEMEFVGGSINFRATVVNPSDVSTRAEITATSIKAADFNTPFYVEMTSGDDTRYGVYEVTSGNEGRLSSIAGSEPLNWLSPEGNHLFYSWTMPWDTDEYQPGASSASTTISFDQNAPMYANVKGQEKNNCRFLEKFIGTKAGPVSYRDNGEYVELQYDHLVSKIRVGSVLLIKGDGTTDNSISGEITFIGMPQTATFNRRPEDGSAPKVTGNSETDGDPMRVTYNFGSNQSSTFYVCPETDFSKLEFQVHLDNAEYNLEGDYYGNFSNVNFLRDIYANWDEDKLATVLYAGEMMTLNLTLTQGHGVGVTMTIHGWDVSSPKSGTSYSHPGIYTAGQAKDVSDLFAGNYTKDEAEEMFGMYGDTMDGDKVFPIYEDVNMGQFSFSMDKEYIIDGMGHTLTMTPRTSNNQKIVRVGPCRDIYLTDGTNTVYIDSDGNIFLVTAEGELVSTGNTLPVLNDSEYTYDIDLLTGKASSSRQKS